MNDTANTANLSGAAAPVRGVVQGAPQNVREWSTRLCDCCADCKTCCCYIFCLCCLMCSIRRKMNECCCVPCLPFGLMAMRTKMRTMYGINGGICKDFCTFTCCWPCLVCQLDRELTHVGL